MKKKLLLAFGLATPCVAYCQIDSAKVRQAPLFKKDSIEALKAQGSEIELERPFNLFASAGVAYRFGEVYNVAVSPIDNTVQFEKVSPLTSGFSLGLVWNPFPDYASTKRVIKFRNKLIQDQYEIARTHAAVALLVNVFQLSYTASQFNSSIPINVGFGAGYRNENFLALFTIEFMKENQPRQYFIDSYMDKNKQLILSGSQEPVRTISSDDNSLFVPKLFPAIGFKIAYSFSKKPK